MKTRPGYTVCRFPQKRQIKGSRFPQTTANKKEAYQKQARFFFMESWNQSSASTSTPKWSDITSPSSPLRTTRTFRTSTA